MLEPSGCCFSDPDVPTSASLSRLPLPACTQVFLGRTWITDVIQSYGHVKTKFTAIPETLEEEFANATYLYFVNALGLQVSPSHPCVTQAYIFVSTQVSRWTAHSLAGSWCQCQHQSQPAAHVTRQCHGGAAGASPDMAEETVAKRMLLSYTAWQRTTMLQRHCVSTDMTLAHHAQQGNPVPILYFALHCGNPTNKLSYTPLSLIAQVSWTAHSTLPDS